MELAQTLPVNGKTTTDCPECHKESKLSVNHSHKEYWCNCYRCDFTDRRKKGKLSLAELAEIRRLNEEADKVELKLELPEDYTDEIPLEGRLWLYEASITESTRREYGIGYSEKYKRVVLPVYDRKGNLVWYQLRAVLSGQEPKYLQPSTGRDSIVFESIGREEDTSAVVVEDILSAIRVGRHKKCFSMLGTKATTTQAAKLMEYGHVTTWLDPDRAGRLGAYTIRQTLGLVTEVRNIVTSVDPKKLSDRQIKEALCL
ncbi:putative DNA primase [Alteromonas phage vB_AspP-H4/4]|uniref:DNA primase n=1 Tax=Alteromonas phage vB_AspP-H4/4 TaxID=2928692 RepID=A0A220YL95_9CAUD|nr:DNA primase [Alteromonas phage vB_AspP-H4/4]ASL24394.1 putative DNA primase [Alteromonas phage vB_AspP-H4/4]